MYFNNTGVDTETFWTFSIIEVYWSKIWISRSMSTLKLIILIVIFCDLLPPIVSSSTSFGSIVELKIDQRCDHMWTTSQGLETWSSCCILLKQSLKCTDLSLAKETRDHTATIVRLRFVTLYRTATSMAEEYNRAPLLDYSYSKKILNGIRVAVAYNGINRKLTNNQ